MSKHIWRGNGWRRHVVWWSGQYVRGKLVAQTHCSEPDCEINQRSKP
jgi:hypothetical protein